MSKKKIIAIWSLVTALLIVGAYVSVTFMQRGMVAVMWPQYLKYGSKIGPAIYHSEEISEKKKGGALKVRSLLNDYVMKTSDIDDYEDASIFDKMAKDFSTTNVYLFLCDDREINNVAGGCWINVFKYDPQKVEDDNIGRIEIDTSFAMLDMEKALNQGYGYELQTAIKDDEEICIGVDKYAIKGVELIPLHITVIKDDNIIKEYTPNAESDIPADFEIVQEDEVWIYNKKYQRLGEHITEITLENIEKIKELREIARKTAEGIDFQNPKINAYDEAYQEFKHSPFSLTSISYSVLQAQEGDSLYSLVYVTNVENKKLLLLFCGLTVDIWTVLYSVIVFAFRKRKH